MTISMGKFMIHHRSYIHIELVYIEIWYMFIHINIYKVRAKLLYNSI
jgi:hypothetical protein